VSSTLRRSEEQPRSAASRHAAPWFNASPLIAFANAPSPAPRPCLSTRRPASLRPFRGLCVQLWFARRRRSGRRNERSPGRLRAARCSSKLIFSKASSRAASGPRNEHPIHLGLRSSHLRLGHVSSVRIITRCFESSRDGLPELVIYGDAAVRLILLHPRRGGSLASHSGSAYDLAGPRSVIQLPVLVLCGDCLSRTNSFGRPGANATLEHAKPAAED